MKKIKNNITLINTITSLILQILTLISGFIIPKLILLYFGSEVNGLVSSLTKFLSYIALLEGGITGVVMANLYKPLADKDNEKISSIVNTTKSFYRKIAIVFLIYSLLLAIIYPFVFKSNFSNKYVFLITLILAITSFIQYNFSLTIKNLLNADKKVYVVCLTQSIIIVLSIFLSYLSLVIYPNIHLFKLISAILYIIQPIVFNFYVNKHYNLNINAKKDNELLKSRWDGFSINIAAFIHTNTDILILSFFTNFTTVSVYSVYALVGSGLRTILNFLSNSLSPTIGQLYAKKKYEELSKKMDIYEFLIFNMVFMLFSIAGLLIIPFVMIYTKNITDANYYQPVFGIILLISEGIYLIKNAHVDLAYSANKFKELKIPCFIEAFLNITISLILIKPLGLIGIAIGTLGAMIFRMIYHVWFTNKKLIDRPQKIFYKKLLNFSILTVLGIIISLSCVSPVEYNVMSWIIHGLIYTIVFVIIFIINSLLFYKKELNEIKKYIIKE